jgi:hypothetical protein
MGRFRRREFLRAGLGVIVAIPLSIVGFVFVGASPASAQARPPWYLFRRGMISSHGARGILGLAAFLAVLVASGCNSSPVFPTGGRSDTTTLPQSKSASSSTTVVSAAPCTASQLIATVDFGESRTELGAIKMTNTTAHACSLAGQPNVVVLGRTGNPLNLGESLFHRAPDWPAPTSPIVLSPSGALPQAIVELDWIWCGSPLGNLRFKVQFSGWLSQLEVLSSAVLPSGFSPALCSSPGGQSQSELFAVDYVRGFGANGIIGP